MAAKDNKEKEAALPEGQAEKPKKKSRAKRFIFILATLLIILGGLGFGAYWWFYLREPGAAPEAEVAGTAVTPEKASQEKPKQEAGENITSARVERQTPLPRSAGLVLPLPPLKVNLADPNGRRFLTLGLEVQVNSDVAAQLKAHNARIRDAIIMLLAGKTYGEIASPDGKVMLKAEIAARLNQILGAQKVVQVYLTDFVVQ